VESVSWEDVQDFIRRLNERTGRNYRLPTEAEWEFAARGGNNSLGYQYAGGSNLGDVAWYEGNAGGKTHPVGQKRPNELGLYDMSGNVWEWCHDWYGVYTPSAQTNPRGPANGSGRVDRGGSWDRVPQRCRVAYRGGVEAVGRYNVLGLRLARTP
jgi:formylglycine-generating enzyme required for sulfatase activity